MSAQTLRVLALLLSTSDGELAGAEIGRASKLQSGTLYPILARLEACGWLESRWEIEDAKALGRPRRRYYRITGLGATRARSELRALQPAVSGSEAWA